MSFYIITLSDCQRQTCICIYIFFYLIYSDITPHCSGTNENAYQNTFGSRRTRTECKISAWLHPGLHSLIFIVLRVSQPVALSCCDTYKYISQHLQVTGEGMDFTLSHAAIIAVRRLGGPVPQLVFGETSRIRFYKFIKEEDVERDKALYHHSQPPPPPPSTPIPQFGIPLWRFLPPGA